MVQPASFSDPFISLYHRGLHWVMCGVKWAQAMGICQCVHDATLTSVSLWSNVDLDHKNFYWVELCLKRACNHILSLNGSVCYTNDLSTQHLLKLFQQADSVHLRIQPLHSYEEDIYGNEHNDALDALAHNCLYQPQETLCSLEIYDEHGLAAPEWDTFVFNGTKFLGGSTINLMHLLLDKIHFDSVPFMPLLCRLIVYQMHNTLACVELQAMLVQTLALVILCVDSPYNPAQPHNQFPLQIPEICGQPVDLPHLSDLRLSGSIAQVSQILQLLPPMQTIVNFELNAG
jgi:hypothetical protein